MGELLDIDLLLRAREEGMEHLDSATGHLGLLSGAAHVAAVGLATASAGMLLLGGEAVHTVEEAGHAAHELSEAYGLTGQQASSWIAAAKQVGLSSETLSTGFKFLTKDMEKVRLGLEKQPEQLEQLRQVTARIAIDQQKYNDAVAKFGPASEAAQSAQLALSGEQDKAASIQHKLAEQGSGALADALRDLGINLMDSKGQFRDMNSVLLEASDAFEKMPDGPQKAADALALFGRSGTNMLPIINQGSASIQAMMDSAQKAGDVLSNKGVDSAQQYYLAHKKVDMAIQGIFMSIGTMLMPALTTAADYLSSTAIPAVSNMGKEFGEHLVPIIKNDLVPMWNNFLFPVIKSLIEFVKKDAIPVIQSLASWFGTNLVPPIQQVAEWIGQHLWPAFIHLADTLKNDVLPAVENIGTFFVNYALKPLIDLGETVIPVVISALQFLADHFWIVEGVAAIVIGRFIVMKTLGLAEFITGTLIPALSYLSTGYWELIVSQDGFLAGAKSLILWMLGSFVPTLGTATRAALASVGAALSSVAGFIGSAFVPAFYDVNAAIAATVVETQVAADEFGQLELAMAPVVGEFEAVGAAAVTAGTEVEVAGAEALAAGGEMEAAGAGAAAAGAGITGMLGPIAIAIGAVAMLALNWDGVTTSLHNFAFGVNDAKDGLDQLKSQMHETDQIGQNFLKGSSIMDPDQMNQALQDQEGLMDKFRNRFTGDQDRLADNWGNAWNRGSAQVQSVMAQLAKSGQFDTLNKYVDSLATHGEDAMASLRDLASQGNHTAQDMLSNITKASGDMLDSIKQAAEGGQISWDEALSQMKNNKSLQDIADNDSATWDKMMADETEFLNRKKEAELTGASKTIAQFNAMKQAYIESGHSEEEAATLAAQQVPKYAEAQGAIKNWATAHKLTYDAAKKLIDQQPDLLNTIVSEDNAAKQHQQGLSGLQGIFGGLAQGAQNFANNILHIDLGKLAAAAGIHVPATTLGPAHAKGGYFDVPHMALIAEGGEGESIIPNSKLGPVVGEILAPFMSAMQDLMSEGVTVPTQPNNSGDILALAQKIDQTNNLLSLIAGAQPVSTGMAAQRVGA